MRCAVLHLPKIYEGTVCQSVGMSPEGIVASDATDNDFHDDHPNGFSIISVAIAVEDRDSFNQSYFEIVGRKISEYGMKIPTPIIKDKYINRYVPLWQQEEARKDIVLELLAIDSLDTIYVTETYLQPRWIELYRDDSSAYRRETSMDFVEDILFQYYDIISLWRYLDRYEGSESAYCNVITDDFSGQVCKAYEELGERCDNFDVVPHGDRTYPVLSMADLVTGLLKQEVYPLRKDEIQEYIEDDTPAYVQTESIHDDHLEYIVPHKTDSCRTDLLRPDPTLYLHRGQELSKDRLYSTDLFSYACAYAQQEGGCVKLLEESNDRHHFTGDDVLICLDDAGKEYRDYEELNSKNAVKVLNRAEGLEFLRENLAEEMLLEDNSSL